MYSLGLFLLFQRKVIRSKSLDLHLVAELVLTMLNICDEEEEKVIYSLHYKIHISSQRMLN